MDLRPYPGSSAPPAEIIAPAEEYRAAAKALMNYGRAGQPLSRAPARLCAIHAIELYLNAFLMHHGQTPEKVRGHGHDLAERTRLAVANGLIFRKRTRAHLIRMTEEREYLITRYGPEMASAVSQVNRLMATLDEIAYKVRLVLDPECSVSGAIAASNPNGANGAQAS